MYLFMSMVTSNIRRVRRFKSKKSETEHNYRKNLSLIYERDVVEANAIAAGTNMSKEDLDKKYAKYRNI